MQPPMRRRRVTVRPGVVSGVPAGQRISVVTGSYGATPCRALLILLVAVCQLAYGTRRLLLGQQTRCSRLASFATFAAAAARRAGSAAQAAAVVERMGLGTSDVGMPQEDPLEKLARTVPFGGKQGKFFGLF